MLVMLRMMEKTGAILSVIRYKNNYLKMNDSKIIILFDKQDVVVIIQKTINTIVILY